MGTNNATRRRRGPGRPRKHNTADRPYVGADVSGDIANAVEELSRTRHRSKSFILSVALARLIKDDEAGRIDWADPYAVPDPSRAEAALALLREWDSDGGACNTGDCGTCWACRVSALGVSPND